MEKFVTITNYHRYWTHTTQNNTNMRPHKHSLHHIVSLEQGGDKEHKTLLHPGPPNLQSDPLSLIIQPQQRL